MQLLKAVGYFSVTLVSWLWRTAWGILIFLRHPEFLVEDSFTAIVKSLQLTEAQRDDHNKPDGMTLHQVTTFGASRLMCHSPHFSLYIVLPWEMLIHKYEGVCLPMQLTEQYAFTSCSAMLCCETEMTVCGESMCLNSSVQIQSSKQLEVL